jgi:hypothetical protein
VRVREGDNAFPTVDIGAAGINLSTATVPVQMRSDNDWLIYNLEAAEQGIAELVDHAAQGRCSLLRIRDGTVGINHVVNGLYRRCDSINLEISHRSTCAIPTARSPP